MADDQERGKIRNREQKQKIIDATRVRFGAITMTDIDSYFEFDNHLSIFIEIKYNDAEPQGGQRLALVRLADDVKKSGKLSALIVASYYNTDGDINLDALSVRMIYTNGHWHCIRGATVKEMMTRLLASAGHDPITGKKK